jgi:CRISPR-associated protein Csm3
MTGLRIGGSQETMEISGLDNPIIRNPATAEPFIPGSSLKGRMRGLDVHFVNS